MRRSIDPVQRPARCGEGVDPALDLGIFHQGRSVMGLDPRVDDQWTAAPPVLLVDERIDSFDVGRGIGPGECDPEEVSKIPRRELAVIDDHDQGE